MKNIIFDLGGVIVNIDYSRTLRELSNLGVKDTANFFTQDAQSQLCDDFELGKISAENFRCQLQRQLNFTAHADLIDAAWSALLLDVPHTKIQQISTLKKRGHRLFVLSNTNSIHIENLHNHLKIHHGIPNLDTLFEKVYYSHQIHLRKPSSEIFQFVVETHQLDTAQTLFIDDTARHIQGAKSIGLQTILLPQNAPLPEILFSDN